MFRLQASRSLSRKVFIYGSGTPERTAYPFVLSGLDGDKNELHDCSHRQNERVTYPYHRQVLRATIRPSWPISRHRPSCCQRILLTPKADATDVSSGDHFIVCAIQTERWIPFCVSSLY